MRQNNLAAYAREHGHIPLSWAGSTMNMNYINIGDALSPVMVALLSGMGVARVPSKSHRLRMGCVGTIGHGFSGGEVHFWGTGASRLANPSAPKESHRPFEIPAGSDFQVAATRGPVSERLLTGDREGTIGVYGDPVWLLPHFYKPDVEKRWKLGVIVHLSELSDRETEAHVREELLRYNVPNEFKDDIRLINTVGSIDVAAIKNKIDEILACERIVSTSLHGLVFAESYGIPCLHLTSLGADDGLADYILDDDCALDLRVVDLYRGLGMKKLPVFSQSLSSETNWEKLVKAVDQAWVPKMLDEHRLIGAFPLDYRPLSSPLGATIWDHPVVKGIQLQHDVVELNRLDREHSIIG